MPVEQFRGYIAAIVAALAVIGGAIGAYLVWYNATFSGQTTVSTDVALIMSVFTGLIAAGTTFLFVQESASRASNAAERSFTNGATTALTPPPTPTVTTNVTDGAATSTVSGSSGQLPTSGDILPE